MTEIEELLNRVKALDYPNTMSLIQGEITGRAFFPGGRGTFDNTAVISNKPIMVLGQDFDTEANFKKAVAAGQENVDQNPTWRNLLALLKQAGVEPQSCFFTNAIMGVRVGSQGVGKSPAFQSEPFIQQCREFFLLQLMLQKPDTILVLGKYPAELIAPLAKDLKDWLSVKSFASLDASNIQVNHRIRFSNGVTSTLVLLTHPSYRHINAKHRKYAGFSGVEAEAEMVKAAVAEL